MKVQKMTRADAESNLDFLGFIIFENKLKPSTTGVIAELSQAGIRNIMCTGDNILTAISVARECGLISAGETCYVPRFSEGNDSFVEDYVIWTNISTEPDADIKSPLRWECVDDPALKLDENTLLVQSAMASRFYRCLLTVLQPLPASNGVDLSIPAHNVNMNKYAIALSGDVFRWMVDYGKDDVLKRVCNPLAPTLAVVGHLLT